MHTWATKVKEDDDRVLRRAVKIYHQTGQIEAPTPYALMKYLLEQVVQKTRQWEIEQQQQQQGQQQAQTPQQNSRVTQSGQQFAQPRPENLGQRDPSGQYRRGVFDGEDEV